MCEACPMHSIILLGLGLVKWGGTSPGAKGVHTWGENGGFSTNFRAAVAARERNPNSGKSLLAHLPYLSNA